MNFRRLAVAFLAVTLALPALAHAAWAPNGNPLCTAAGEQVAPSAASDGSGGMIVAWQDRRRGSSFNDLYATRVLGDGSIAPGWPVDGVALTQSGIAGAPRAVPDGSGGALVLWLEPGGLYGQRVTGGGALGSGFPANGKLIVSSSAGVQGITPAMGFEAVTDAAGGAYVLCFQQSSSPFGGIQTGARVTRVGPDAVPPAAWTPSPWVGIGSGNLGALAHIAAGLGGSCVFGVITRFDAQTNPSSAYAGRIQPDGTLLSQYLPEYPTTPFPGNNPGPVDVSVVADGVGGHFAFKRDSDGFFTIFANHGHHVNNTWGETWPQASLVPFLHFAVSDGGLGVFLVGTTGSPLRLEADYFSSVGTAGWPVGSVVLSQPTAFQNVVTTGLMSGAFAIWSENGGTGFDIRAALVSSAGTITPGNGPAGDPICNASGSQLSPTFVPDGPGALAAWEDQRSSTADIYANRVVLNLPTAVQVSLASTDVSSDAVRLRWSVIDPNGAATVLRRTRADAWITVGAPIVSSGAMSFEDRDVVPGTEYGYALAFSGEPDGTRLGEHWVQVPALASALTGFVPNPSTGAPRIAFALRTGESARLEVVDVAGRVVLAREVGALGPGSHSIGLAGARLAAGVYLMRLTEGDRVHTARGMVVR